MAKKLEFIFLLVAHVLLLAYILHVLYAFGTYTGREVVMHFILLAIYGGGLIRLSAYLAKRRHEGERDHGE